MKWSRLVGWFSLMLGAALLTLNLYGEWTTMRIAEDVPKSTLRFPNDLTLSYDEAIAQLEKRDDETDAEFAIRLTGVIQKSLAHLDRWTTHQPDLYNQRVPIEENIWLHLLGRFSTQPEIVRYHFGNYKRTMERGIGLCGDHSLVLSGVLWDNDIPNLIRAYPDGHVLIETQPTEGPPLILDPDFGVHYEKVSTDNEAQIMKRTALEYGKAGYGAFDIETINEIYSGESQTFKNPMDFMKKRYILEHILYVVKWLAPAFLIGLGILLLRRRKSNV